MTAATTGTRRAGLVVAAWSLVLLVPHLDWAAGGRGGLGSQSGAADAAFDQPWFAAYNLAACLLTLTGGAWAAAEAAGVLDSRGRRRLRRAAWAAGVLLLLRGLLGVSLLGSGVVTGESLPPPVLVAVEPWFLLGGVAYLWLARRLPHP